MGGELNRHFFGGFYASKINYNANEYSPPHRLAGGFYQFTFYRETNLQFGAMLRAGFVDSEFFVYLPSLVVDYVMSDYFKLSLTAGARGQNPAIGLNAFLNIPLKKMNSLIQLKLVLRKRISSLLVLPLMLCFSCKKYEDIAGYKEYLIKEGKHGAEDTGGGEMTDHALVYDIIFDSTCIYEIASEDQADINKLFGFSDCNDLHHTNSARFGWRWYQNELQILSYTYNNDVVSYQELGAVEFDKS